MLGRWSSGPQKAECQHAQNPGMFPGQACVCDHVQGALQKYRACTGTRCCANGALEGMGQRRWSHLLQVQLKILMCKSEAGLAPAARLGGTNCPPAASLPHEPHPSASYALRTPPNRRVHLRAGHQPPSRQQPQPGLLARPTLHRSHLTPDRATRSSALPRPPARQPSRPVRRAAASPAAQASLERACRPPGLRARPRPAPGPGCHRRGARAGPGPQCSGGRRGRQRRAGAEAEAEGGRAHFFPVRDTFSKGPGCLSIRNPNCPYICCPPGPSCGRRRPPYFAPPTHRRPAGAPDTGPYAAPRYIYPAGLPPVAPYRAWLARCVHTLQLENHKVRAEGRGSAKTTRAARAVPRGL